MSNDSKKDKDPAFSMGPRQPSVSFETPLPPGSWIDEAPPGVRQPSPPSQPQTEAREANAASGKTDKE